MAKLNDLQQDPSSPVAGTAGGITVVEFFDYRCGYCKGAESAIRKLLAAILTSSSCLRSSRFSGRNRQWRPKPASQPTNSSAI
ncbi:hypothetical protein SBA6_300060 [Candidatus Sulfopaludibacter sp. SbA6]|nr:hypothetical protein SBA6_300060 [Candidatus Sulfopaludibacter sp. SbA6]